ncbi:hypothetical protein lerEdw1_009635, partial [Lerista edwardsae]
NFALSVRPRPAQEEDRQLPEAPLWLEEGTKLPEDRKQEGNGDKLKREPLNAPIEKGSVWVPAVFCSALLQRASVPSSKRMPRERRAGQLMDPPWRERNWASGAATVVVLILTFLCKVPMLALQVNLWPPMTKGFMYSSAGGRFQLTGNPAHGDCSFSINDAKDEDDEHYYLRINDGGSAQFSYGNGYVRPRVNVAELTEKPEIRKSSEMISGKPVTLTCQAPGTCSGTPPRISWTPYSVRTSAVDWQQPHSNGSRTYSSNITITSSQYEGQDLTCSVQYPGGNWASVANTIHVATACSIMKAPYINPVSVMVEEGNALSLYCEADSRPDPLLSWTKGNKTLRDSKQDGGHSLQLSEIRSEDAGLYRCQATNLIGSAEKTVQMNVQ